MLPVFPSFEKLELRHKSFFDLHTQYFPPYSDFNFVSLWSYNTKGNLVSLLNNNLVIKLSDYITDKPIFSFLGNNKVLDTVSTLMKLIKGEKLEPTIHLVPEDSIKDEKTIQKKYDVKESRDHFDYIMSTDNMTSLLGGQFHTHRNMISKFKRTTTDIELKELDLDEENIKEQILDLSYLWGKRKNKTDKEISTELTAIKNLLSVSNSFHLTNLGLYVEGKLEAYYIAEIVHGNYAIGHFRKANTAYPGIFTFMDHEMAKTLQIKGCKYLNYEQDLGIETLRKSKLSWHPIHFLRKFAISQR